MMIVSSSSTSLFPTSSSRTSSPTLVRRDSILKRAGSVKGEQKKNVSIVTDLPSVEMISERRKGERRPRVEGRESKLTFYFLFAGRPASLILAKGEKPIFKISRSYSFDDDNEGVASDARTNDESPNKDESQPLVN